MHLIHKVDASVLLAELVLRVHEYEALLCGDFGSPPEYGPGILLELFVILGGNEAGSYDVLLGNVLVVTLALVVGVMIGSGNFWFSTIPSGIGTPQISRFPALYSLQACPER